MDQPKGIKKERESRSGSVAHAVDDAISVSQPQKRRFLCKNRSALSNGDGIAPSQTIERRRAGKCAGVHSQPVVVDSQSPVWVKLRRLMGGTGREKGVGEGTGNGWIEDDEEEEGEGEIDGDGSGDSGEEQ